MGVEGFAERLKNDAQGGGSRPARGATWPGGPTLGACDNRRSRSMTLDHPGPLWLLAAKPIEHPTGAIKLGAWVRACLPKALAVLRFAHGFATSASDGPLNETWL